MKIKNNRFQETTIGFMHFNGHTNEILQILSSKISKYFFKIFVSNI